MTDEHDDDAPAPEPAETPEVVDGGGGEGAGAAAARPGRPVGRLVRIGLTVLAALGLLAVVLAGQSAANPERGVCSEALREIEDFQDDDDNEDFEFDVDDVDCGDAAEREAAIDIARSEPINADLNSEGAYRTSAFFGIGIGLLLAVGSFLTRRTMSKRTRMAALVGAGLAILYFGFLLFPIVMAGLLFGVYAIFFSADARAVFGAPTGPRRFRPEQ